MGDYRQRGRRKLVDTVRGVARSRRQVAGQLVGDRQMTVSSEGMSRDEYDTLGWPDEGKTSEEWMNEEIDND